MYSLAIEVLKRSDALDYLIRSTQILIKEPRLNPWLARVLITELLWGKERLPGESKPIKTILSYQTAFQKCQLELPSDNSTIDTIKGNNILIFRIPSFEVILTTLKIDIDNTEVPQISAHTKQGLEVMFGFFFCSSLTFILSWCISECNLKKYYFGVRDFTNTFLKCFIS